MVNNTKSKSQSAPRASDKTTPNDHPKKAANKNSTPKILVQGLLKLASAWSTNAKSPPRSNTPSGKAASPPNRYNISNNAKRHLPLLHQLNLSLKMDLRLKILQTPRDWI